MTAKRRRTGGRKTARPPRRPGRARHAAIEAAPVTARELRALQRELERRLRPIPAGRAQVRGNRKPAPIRWNPEPEDVQRSVAQLVLTIVEFLRRLMERQAIHRMERHTLTDAEVEAVGLALMRLEETVHEIGRRFGLDPEDLNLDLGPAKLI